MGPRRTSTSTTLAGVVARAEEEQSCSILGMLHHHPHQLSSFNYEHQGRAAGLDQGMEGVLVRCLVQQQSAVWRQLGAVMVKEQLMLRSSEFVIWVVINQYPTCSDKAHN